MVDLVEHAMHRVGLAWHPSCRELEYPAEASALMRASSYLIIINVVHVASRSRLPSCREMMRIAEFPIRNSGSIEDCAFSLGAVLASHGCYCTWIQGTKQALEVHGNEFRDQVGQCFRNPHWKVRHGIREHWEIFGPGHSLHQQR